MKTPGIDEDRVPEFFKNGVPKMDEDGVPLMFEDGVPWRSDAKRGVGIIKVTWRRDRLTSRDSGEV